MRRIALDLDRATIINGDEYSASVRAIMRTGGMYNFLHGKVNYGRDSGGRLVSPQHDINVQIFDLTVLDRRPSLHTFLCESRLLQHSRGSRVIVKSIRMQPRQP